MTVSRDDFRFFTPLRVRWAECDAQGVVFNAQYYFFYDVAITEYFRELDGSPFEGPEFYTVSSAANFRAPAVFDDLLDIGVRCARVGRTSITYEMAIWRGEDFLSDGRFTYVHVERGTKNKAPLPETYIERLAAFEKTSPERT